MSQLSQDSICRKLIGGMDIDGFNEDIREKRATKFPGAIDMKTLAQIFSINRLEVALANERIPPIYADVIFDAFPSKLADLQREGGKSSLDVIATSLERGATICVCDIQKFDDALERLVRDISVFFAATAQVNLYLTPPNQAGFKPHFDTTDIFILQCAGSKEWHIHSNYSDQIDLPLIETEWNASRYKPSGDFETVVLEVGDVLYLPRGTMHDARCTDLESMHLTISVAPLTMAELIGRDLLRAARDDVGLRQRIPWSVTASDDELRALEQQIRHQAHRIADRIDVVGVLRSHQRRLQASSGPAAEGQLQRVIAALVDDARGPSATPEFPNEH